MKHFYYYRVYNADGRVIFETTRREDAKIWLTGTNYMVRSDLLGNEPDKTYKAK